MTTLTSDDTEVLSAVTGYFTIAVGKGLVRATWEKCEVVMEDDSVHGTGVCPPQYQLRHKSEDVWAREMVKAFLSFALAHVEHSSNFAGRYGRRYVSEDELYGANEPLGKWILDHAGEIEQAHFELRESEYRRKGGESSDEDDARIV